VPVRCVAGLALHCRPMLTACLLCKALICRITLHNHRLFLGGGEGVGGIRWLSEDERGEGRGVLVCCVTGEALPTAAKSWGFVCSGKDPTLPHDIPGPPYHLPQAGSFSAASASVRVLKFPCNLCVRAGGRGVRGWVRAGGE